MTEQIEEVVADEATVTLAYYDSRKVPDERVRRIFNCLQSDLDRTRQTPAYKAEIAKHEAEQVETSTAIDDSWDLLERGSLGNLVETMDSITDERTLLTIAVQANKAGRRRGGDTPTQQGGNDIPTQDAAGNTKVVRLRARFLERLTSAEGGDRMLERQVEIEASASAGDLDEVIDPRQMKKLLREKIGVDTDDMHVRHHQGPDGAPGKYIDFGEFD